MTFTTKNTKREFYSVNFGTDFAALVRLDGSPLFPTGCVLADAAVVTHTPNSFDDGLSLTSVSDTVWANASRVRSIPYTSHQGMVDFANNIAKKHPEMLKIRSRKSS